MLGGETRKNLFYLFILGMGFIGLWIKKATFGLDIETIRSPGFEFDAIFAGSFGWSLLGRKYIYFACGGKKTKTVFVTKRTD